MILPGRHAGGCTIRLSASIAERLQLYGTTQGWTSDPGAFAGRVLDDVLPSVQTLTRRAAATSCSNFKPGTEGQPQGKVNP